MNHLLILLFWLVSFSVIAQRDKGNFRFYFRPGSDLRSQFVPLSKEPKPLTYEDGINKTFRKSDNSMVDLGIGYLTPKSWEFGLNIGFRYDHSYGFSDQYFLLRNPSFELEHVSKYGGAEKELLNSNWAMARIGRQFKKSRFYCTPYVELSYGTIKTQGVAAFLKQTDRNYFIIDNTSVSFTHNLGSSIGCEAGYYILNDIFYIALSPAFNTLYHRYRFRNQTVDMLGTSKTNQASYTYSGTRLMFQICIGLQVPL